MLLTGTVVAVLLASCGDDSPRRAASTTIPGVTDVTDGAGEPSGSSSSPDGSWVLVSGAAGGTPVTLIDGWDVTIDFDGPQIGGTAACNGYGGTARIDDGAISIGELSQTEMGCQTDVMSLEQQFLASLATVTAITVDDDRLTLAGAGDEWLFERLAPVPTADILGTTLILDTVIDGETATNSPLMSSATLELRADGTLTGSTGCRQLTGEWVETGAEILFTTFSAIDDPAAGACAPESEALDSTIVSVLGDGFGVEIDGNRITLTASGNQGLSYLAEGG